MANPYIPQDAQRGLRRAQLAAISADGSIAARDNPNNYGSELSRKYPGLFGPNGMSNPDYIAQQKLDQHQQALDQNITDRAYTLRKANQTGLHQSMLDQGIDDTAYRDRRLTALGLRKPPTAGLPNFLDLINSDETGYGY